MGFHPFGRMVRCTRRFGSIVRSRTHLFVPGASANLAAVKTDNGPEILIVLVDLQFLKSYWTLRFYSRYSGAL